MRRKDDKFDAYLDPTKPITAPAGDCVMSTCSPFYRSNITNATLSQPMDRAQNSDRLLERLTDMKDESSANEKNVDLLFPEQL